MSNDLALRPYQQEAVDAIAAGLDDGGRGQLHAACGSGKTLMSIDATTRILPGPAIIVVLAPSLALVSQSVKEWRSRARVDAVLAVCSDDTVTDAPVHLADIPAETTTDPGVIAEWLRTRTGRLLVTGTYASAGRLAEALRTLGAEADIVVHDEAHHLTGVSDYTTRRILDAAVMPARRRLFMTATPRTDDVVRAESADMLTMSDPAVFGPVLYHYPWARAISDGYLDDYRIVVLGVTEREVLDMLQDDEHDYTDGPGAPGLRTLAAQAVLAKAAHAHGLRRVIAFCPRIESAREFARTLPTTLRALPEEAKPSGPLTTERITSEQNLAEREEILHSLRRPPGGPDAWTVLTNVRCLSEGLDVPAVDGVLFTHPKRSQVDVVQAVGRALRKSSDGDGVATVIVPIVVPDSPEEIVDLDAGEYHVLWQVVRALRAHDESLGIALDEHRAQTRIEGEPRLPARITVQLPPGTSRDALRTLTALLVRQTTSQWWEGHGHARDYVATHGDLAVPSGYVTADGHQLGHWLANARQHRRKGWLRQDRVDALDKLGMIWSPKGEKWEAFTAELRAFRERHGHSLVPQSYVAPSGYRLGSRVNRVRTSGRVPVAVRKALDDLGMVWDTRDLRWQETYQACQRYVADHGHLHVPKKYVTPEGVPLGSRLSVIRKRHADGALDPAEHRSLEELGMAFDGDRPWAAFMEAADRYVAEHGSLAGVERDYVDSTGYRLGDRIMYYRSLNAGTKAKTIRLPDQRRQELDARGMVWRIAPSTAPLSKEQTATLRALSGVELGAAIVALIDGENVAQKTIAEALGVHRSYLNTKIHTFRKNGTWVTRKTAART
ncbi:Helicase associated domain protein [Streptomyces sp. NPDC004579]|uniref:DEAD/DEAH box helicase n=1 Tax=Streptomyces sp. NPDC004579 TaxID=3154667 RepID=UPI0033B70604